MLKLSRKVLSSFYHSPPVLVPRTRLTRVMSATSAKVKSKRNKTTALV